MGHLHADTTWLPAPGLESLVFPRCITACLGARASDREPGAPTHEFWPEDVPVADMVTGMEGALQGYRHLTDAYLLALAHRRKGVLATFDRGIRALAGDARKDALEIVPIR
jgi:hypothetical protein